MESPTIPPAEGMHLRRLRDLTEFEVADDNPDVRGWSVRGSDGQQFGQVYELIVELEALKVRYLDVLLDPALTTSDQERHILLPIGVAALDEEADNIFVPSLNVSSVLEYPPFVEIQITRAYEEAMLRSLQLPATTATPAANFYHQDSYDSQRFYRRQKP